jgi:ribose 5-phosphate isomerase B
MKIIIGNDHGGYKLKLKIVEYLKNNNYAVEDIGTDSENIVRYPLYAQKVTKAVQTDSNTRGILICSTGIGMSIIANKFKGIRASMCTSTYMGEMTRAHNNSNILCLGGKTTSEADAINILEAWLTTEYEGGRHDISLEIINKIEDHNFSPLDFKSKE